MKLTNIIKKLAPLAAVVSIACTPIQVKETLVEKPQATVTHKDPKVTYISESKREFQAPYNPSSPSFGDGLGYQGSKGYGRIHGLGEVDTGAKTGRNANVSFGKKRRAVIPRLVIKGPKRPTIVNHYKGQSDLLTKNVCTHYIRNNQRDLSLHLDSCVDFARKVCGFDKIRDNRTDEFYRACLSMRAYEGTLKPWSYL